MMFATNLQLEIEKTYNKPWRCGPTIFSLISMQHEGHTVPRENVFGHSGFLAIKYTRLRSANSVKMCTVHQVSVISLSKMFEWFYTNLHHFKQITCVSSPT